MKKTLLNFLGAGIIFLNSCSQVIIKSVSYSNFPEDPVIRECFNKAASIEYKSEPDGDDYWQTPEETERLGTGDCEDKAIYLHNQLKKNKIESEVVFGYIYSSHLFGKWNMHGWVECIQNKEIYVLDPTSWIIEKRRNLPKNEFIAVDSDTYNFINKRFKANQKYIDSKLKEYENKIKGK